MVVPLVSHWFLKVRRQALMTEIEMHVASIRDLSAALLELSAPGDELEERVLALLEALE